MSIRGGVITKHPLVTLGIFFQHPLPQIYTSVLNHFHACNAAASPHFDCVLESSLYLLFCRWNLYSLSDWYKWSYKPSSWRTPLCLRTSRLVTISFMIVTNICFENERRYYIELSCLIFLGAIYKFLNWSRPYHPSEHCLWVTGRLVLFCAKTKNRYTYVFWAIL